jgi:hypothetical protein
MASTSSRTLRLLSLLQSTRTGYDIEVIVEAPAEEVRERIGRGLRSARSVPASAGSG